MTLTTTQLEAIVARALPDERLRAGDALHLAIAHRLGARLASLDRRLNEAAVFHHIACEDVLG